MRVSRLRSGAAAAALLLAVAVADDHASGSHTHTRDDHDWTNISSLSNRSLNGTNGTNGTNATNRTVGDECYAGGGEDGGEAPVENKYQIIGAVMAVFASSMGNLGVSIQKISHNRDARQHPSKRKPYFKRCLWWCGLSTVIIGSLLDFEALSFATQVLVATTGGAVTILSNVTFAVLLLKEKLTVKDSIGSLLVILGVVFAALANPPDHLYSVSDFEPMFVEPEFLSYFGLQVIVVICIFLGIKHVEEGSKLQAYLYAVSAGIFGGWSVLLGKCTSEVVRETISDPVNNNQFLHFSSYVFIVGMLAFLVTQTHLLNMALMLGDTLSVFPFFQVSE